MLLIILGAFWVAILVPVAVRRFRDSGTEKSIHSFHAEHEVLSRQEYSVPPAHRLDPSEQEERRHELEQRPRLTVVHPGDTYRSLESRTSWDEWANDYDYDREEGMASSESANRYVSAYSSMPNDQEVRNAYSRLPRAGTMKARRTTFFMALLVAAAVLSGMYFLVGGSIIEDLAILAWVGFTCYVALALFAVSQGFLDESSLPLRIPQGRRIAAIEPIYDEYDELDDSEFYDADDDSAWRRDSPSRYAVG
ncbi:MAG: hypothetical protein ABSG24_09130 [Acidimicrobiales bacterium]